MPNTANLQTNFQGGEWSPWKQGRADDPRYRSAMSTCRNGLPTEEGGWIKRSGTQEWGGTVSGGPGRLIPFNFAQNAPYTLEFTEGWLRFWQGNVLAYDPADVVGVAGVSTDDPAIVYTTAPHGMVTGNYFRFLFPSVVVDTGLLRGRIFRVETVVSSTAFTIVNERNQPVDGALVAWSPATECQVAPVLTLSTPWVEDDLEDLVLVQREDRALILSANQPPYELVITDFPSQTLPHTFRLTEAPLADGPYLDPLDGAFMVPDVVTGEVQMTLGFRTWSATTAYTTNSVVSYAGVNYKSISEFNLNNTPSSSPTKWEVTNAGVAFGPSGAEQEDVGRLVRLWSAPEDWSASTSYSVGDRVSFEGVVWQAVSGNSNQQPGTPGSPVGNYWSIVPSGGAAWIWGVVSEVVNGEHIKVLLVGGDLLYLLPIRRYRVGVFSDKTGYPTCGTYHEGRLWLGGATFNRVDSSVAGSATMSNFAPTLADGTVVDSSAISLKLDSDNADPALWIASDERGLTLGTQSKEWRLTASALNDPLTPTSAKAKPVTRFGCADVQPVSIGGALVFVQKEGRKVLELLQDVYSGRFSAPHLTQAAKHLTIGGIRELAYQEEAVPILWARTGDNKLIGCTYRRASLQASEAPVIFGWHRHDLGTERDITSIAVGATPDGLSTTLLMVTRDADGYHTIEALAPFYEPDESLANAWFLDGAKTITGAWVDDDNVTVMGGSHRYEDGGEAYVFMAGLQRGPFTVGEAGSITIPFDDTFTKARVLSWTGGDYGGFGVPMIETSSSDPGDSSIPGTIQGIYPNSSVNVVSGTGVGVPLWGSQELLTVAPGNSVGSGVRLYNLVTGSLILEATAAAMLPGGEDLLEGVYGAAFTVTPNGNIFGMGKTGFGLGPIHRFNKDTMALTGTFGSDTGLISWKSDGRGFQTTVYDMTSITVGDTDYVLSSEAGSEKVVSVMNGSEMVYAGASLAFTPQRLLLTKGYAGSTTGTAWGLGAWSSLGGALTDIPLYEIAISEFEFLYMLTNHNTDFGIKYTLPYYTHTSEYGTLFDVWDAGETYEEGDQVINQGVMWSFVPTGPATSSEPTRNNTAEWTLFQNPGIRIYERGTFSLADVDPEWPSFTTPSGLTYDASDNSVIVIVGTAAIVANPVRMVKLRGADASVVWSTPINWNAGVRMGGFQHTSTGAGVITTLAPTTDGSGNMIITVIRTDTGEIVSEYGVKGIANVFSQASNDTTGSVMFWGEYEQQTGSPAPGINTPSEFESWAQLFAGGLFAGNATVQTSYTTSALIGVPFTAQGQVLRAISPEAAGAAAGPALGKTRRTHLYAGLVHETAEFQIGTSFSDLKPTLFRTPGGTPYATGELYSGVHRATLTDSYSFDSQIAWQSTSAYPMTLLSLEAFLATQDR